jgi:hypothetical protein
MKILLVIVSGISFLGGAYLWVWQNDYIGLIGGIFFGSIFYFRIKYWNKPIDNT